MPDNRYKMQVEITSVSNGKSLILRDDGELIFVGKKIEDCPAESGRVPVCPSDGTYQFFNLTLLEGDLTGKVAISTSDNKIFLGTSVEDKGRVDKADHDHYAEWYTPINIFGDIYAFKCNYPEGDEKYLSIDTTYDLLIVREQNHIDRTELFRIQAHYIGV